MTDAAYSPGDTGQYVTMKVYFDGRIESLEKLVDTRLEANAMTMAATLRANQMAIDKAETTINERLALLNEFRNAMKDQAAEYATKAMLDAREDARNAEIKTMWKFIYGLATAIAVIQAILQFTPQG